MTKPVDVLMNRIERFGSMDLVDEHGSYDENTMRLYCALSEAERIKVEDAESAAAQILASISA
jgi:hypothetical protein